MRTALATVFGKVTADAPGIRIRDSRMPANVASRMNTPTTRRLIVGGVSNLTDK
jgi:hypothetical protein